MSARAWVALLVILSAEFVVLAFIVAMGVPW